MGKTKENKNILIEELEEKMRKQKIVIFFDFSKVKTEKLNDLRKKIREAGGEIKIFKKTLARIVFQKLGFSFDFENFKGQLAFLFGFQDEILPLKVFSQFEKEDENIKVLSGFLKKDFLSPERIKELESLLPLPELRTRLAFILFSPLQRLRDVLKNNIANFVFVLSQIKVKKE